MLPILVLVVAAVAGACVGGWYGRWRGLEESGWPIDVASISGLIGRSQVELIQQRQRRRRLALVFEWSLLGALLGLLAIVIVALSISPNR